MSHEDKCRSIRKYLDKKGLYNGLKTTHYWLANGQRVADKGRQTYQNLKKTDWNRKAVK